LNQRKLYLSINLNKVNKPQKQQKNDQKRYVGQINLQRVSSKIGDKLNQLVLEEVRKFKVPTIIGIETVSCIKFQTERIQTKGI